MHLDLIENIVQDSERILKGKQQQVKLVIGNILARGHTLIEDAPGVGKTTLVKYIGKSLGMNISRIQFTNDLLPADILGSSIFNKQSHSFDFHPGPIFGELVLADELNRAPPKTQSALLQAMEEKQVSIEANTYQLPNHFTVIATQNPNVQIGTFSLPESQLDRFSLKLKMGYPDKQSTIDLLKMTNAQTLLNACKQLLSVEQLINTQDHIASLHLDESIYELIYQILQHSRHNNQLIPLSNRCGLDLVSFSKSWAYLNARDYVIPDDIFTIFPYVAGHRLIHPDNSDVNHEAKLADDLLNSI